MAAAALAVPVEASAGKRPPPDIPAVAAYVEMVPTSRGSRPPRPDQAGTIPLAPGVEAELRRIGGPEAERLKTIATSPELGAPRSHRPASDLETPSIGAVAAAADAAGGGDRRLVGLVVVLAAITVVASAAAVYGRRTGSSQPRS